MQLPPAAPQPQPHNHQHHSRPLPLYTISSNQQALQQALFRNNNPAAAALQQAYQLTPLDAAALASFNPQQPAAAVVDGGGASVRQQHQELLQQLRSASRSLFLIYWHADATEDASLRWSAFKAGANMVTHCSHAVAAALQQVAAQQQGFGACGSTNSITCDWCGLPGLSASEYWQHQPLYHIHATNLEGVCQICGRHSSNLARHLHDHHKPSGEGPEQRTGVFALCVIRRPTDGKFLMTQEFAGAGFWVPGGGVDPGESLTQAAVRECWEEAGVHVELRGILALESHHAGEWRRVIFWGEPAQDAASSPSGSSRRQLEPCCCPKSLPDFESAGAAWVAVDELQQLPLRSASECSWFAVLASGRAREVCGPLHDSLQLPDEWAAAFEGFLLL